MKRLSRASRHEDRERGVSAVEFAILSPAMFLLAFLIVQFALWYHGIHVAQAAAQAGARIARAEAAGNPNWEGPAVAKAHERINQIGPRLIEERGVAAIEGQSPSGPLVGVAVTGKAVEVLPGLTLRIEEQSLGPVERFQSDVGT